MSHDSKLQICSKMAPTDHILNGVLLYIYNSNLFDEVSENMKHGTEYTHI